MVQGTRPPPSREDPSQTPTRVERKALAEMGHPLTRELHFKSQDLAEKLDFPWWQNGARPLNVCAAFSCVRTSFFHSSDTQQCLQSEH